MMEAIPLGPMPPELAAAQALPIVGLQVRLQSSACLPPRLQTGALHAEGANVQVKVYMCKLLHDCIELLA